MIPGESARTKERAGILFARMPKSDRKIFGTLFFSIFAAVTGVGVVVPLLPVYAHDLGASGLYIGLIFGAFSLSRTVFLPIFGTLSDRKGRKHFIVWGLFAYTLVSVAFLFFTSVEGLIGIRILQGVASAMIMPVTQAYVGDITPRGSEGAMMGMFNMSLFLSLSIGPLIGGGLKDRFGLEASFGAMGALALAAFLASLFFLPPRDRERFSMREAPSRGFREILKDREIAGLFIVRCAYTACIGIIWAFLPVIASAEFGLSGTLTGVLVTLGVLVSGLMQIPMGFVADRVEKKTWMIAAGGGLVCLSLLAFPFLESFRGLFFASFAFGIGGGVLMPPLLGLAVVKGSSGHAMGAVMGLLTAAHSLGMLAGSLLGGLMMDHFHLRYAFPSGGVLMLAAVGLLLFRRPK